MKTGLSWDCSLVAMMILMIQKSFLAKASILNYFRQLQNCILLDNPENKLRFVSLYTNKIHEMEIKGEIKKRNQPQKRATAKDETIKKMKNR